MIISNNALKLFDVLPSNLIVRINVAWCKNIKELKTIIENATHPIYCDYFMNRAKPPRSKIKLVDVIYLINKMPRVKHFSFSNAENPKEVKKLREQINKKIKLVPKIETVVGIQNVIDICKNAETDMIMYDHADLWIDVSSNTKNYNKFESLLLKKCKKNNIKVYKVQGVIFDEIRS